MLELVLPGSADVENSSNSKRLQCSLLRRMLSGTKKEVGENFIRSPLQ